MRITTIKEEQFDEFSINHILGNYCQTSHYAKLMGKIGLSYEYIALLDDTKEIVAATLVLYKKIGMFFKYAYAPKGFLINYEDKDLLNTFVGLLKSHLKKKGYVFLKINPEIIIGNLNYQTLQFVPNDKVETVEELKKLEFKRRKEIDPFDLLMPRYTAYINMKEYKVNDLEKKIKDKLKTSQIKGLILENGASENIETLYKFVKNNDVLPVSYYKDLYQTFTVDDLVELMLVKIDYEVYLETAKNKYQEELERNAEYNEKIKTDPSDKNMTEKMNSDKLVIEYKQELVEATEGLRIKKNAYIAGALVVKYKNKVHVIASGYDPKYKDLYPSYFMINEMIERFKDGYDYLDMGGISGDFSENSQYYGLDKFKMYFKPEIVEFIGEFDLILNNLAFKGLESNNSLEAEFLKTKPNPKKDED